jgi:hypothetical protein
LHRILIHRHPDILYVENQSFEFFLDQLNLPVLINKALNFRIIIAIHREHVERVVNQFASVIVLLLEPLVESVVVYLVDVSPQDESWGVIRGGPFDDLHPMAFLPENRLRRMKVSTVPL